MRNISDPPEASTTTSKHTSTWTRFLSQFHMRPADDDDPQDWWIASTAIPLVAATTGPLANVMSINALVTPWRNHILLNTTGPHDTPEQVGFHDPRWCIALNATSLACGVAGNIFLLLNFTRRIRYIIALPASIVLWFLATGILIGITAAMHVYDPPISSKQTFSQGYWSAVIAAVLYFVLSIVLVINILGYFLGHYPQHFALTDDQRTLILQTMAFVIWLIVGAAVFQDVMDISFADALYFSDVTILTLGFGDITAPNDVSRGLILPYAVIGIVILGLVVASIREFAREMSYDNVVKAHFQRKRKLTIERSVTIERDSDEDLESKLRRPSQSRIRRPRYGRARSGRRYQEKYRKRPIRSTLNAIGRAAMNRPKILAMKEEKDRFDAMRAIQSETMRFQRWNALVMSLVAFAIVWTCGAAVFWRLESIRYFDALYFGFCSLLTIGYGDITPKSNPGRPFFIVWSLVAVPTMTILISEMSDTVVANFKHATNSFGDWTVLPRLEAYKEFLGKHPLLQKLLQSREERKRVARGFQVGLDVDLDSEGNPISDHPRPTIEKLASSPAPTEHQLARQLAFAIRNTADDLRSGEAKRYSYEEWVEFTRLIRFTDTCPPGAEGLKKDEDEYGIVDWDWIGENSPMLAEQTEPEWVLDRLCESLIRYLDAEKRPASAAGDEEEEPVLKKEQDLGLQDDATETADNNNQASTSEPSTGDPKKDDSSNPLSIGWASSDRPPSTGAGSRRASRDRSISPSSPFAPTPRRGPFRILPGGGRSGRQLSGTRRPGTRRPSSGDWRGEG